MGLFKKKHEFRPDKEHSGILSKLYLTKKQRTTVFKWVLIAAVLVLVSIIQDVIMSRVHIYGATTDFIPLALLLMCMMLDPEVGSVFIITASALYWFSGSAPGPYVILFLTALGIFISILRQNYLRYNFVTLTLCAFGALMIYELAVFSVGFILGYTTGSRFIYFVLSGLYSIVALPVLYPIFTGLIKIGGESWKE